MAFRETLANFRLGGTELFLPKFRITLLRSENPYNARFHVPLWFSKLDLRDYLWNVYNVRILAVRSYVKQSRVQEGKGNSSKPTPNRFHRPRSKKYMTVELERPFVWPKGPEDFKPWNKDEMEDALEEGKEMNKQQDKSYVHDERRSAMKEQAKALLEGKTKWWPMAEKQSGTLLNR